MKFASVYLQVKMQKKKQQKKQKQKTPPKNLHKMNLLKLPINLEAND